MKERPIIFKGEFIPKIIDGTKTMTVRPLVVKAYADSWEVIDGIVKAQDQFGDYNDTPCPYGKEGDRLWVRETFLSSGDGSYEDIYYRADDYDNSKYSNFKWRPSIHMPRWASRITLEITDVKVKRVQEISEEEAKKDGVENPFTEEECNTVVGIIGSKPEDHGYKNYLWHGHVGKDITLKQSDSWEYQYSTYKKAKDSFSSLWNTIYGKTQHKWSNNPWCWFIGFKKVGNL